MLSLNGTPPGHNETLLFYYTLVFFLSFFLLSLCWLLYQLPLLSRFCSLVLTFHGRCLIFHLLFVDIFMLFYVCVFFIFVIFLRPFMFLVFSFLSFQFQDRKIFKKLSIIKISLLTNADIVNLMHAKTNRKHYYYSISKTIFSQLLIK